MEAPLSYPSAVEIIFHWNFQTPRSLPFHSEVSRYLQAVDIIQGSPPFTDECDKAISMAVVRLNYAFLSILTRATRLATDPSSRTQSSSVVTDSSGHDLWEDFSMVFDGNRREAIHDLQSIAGRMQSLGHLVECIHCYRKVRQPFLNTVRHTALRD